MSIDGLFMLELPAIHVIEIGIAMLGIAASLSLANVLIGARVCAQFGIEIVSKFESRWPDLDDSQKNAILTTSKFGAVFSKLILRLFVPFTSMAAGTLFLISISPLLGLVMVVMGGAALFLYIPANKATHKNTESQVDLLGNTKFDSAFKRKFFSIILAKFELFILRKFISASSLMLIFLAILVGYLAYGVAGFSGAVDERLIVVILVVRSSMISMKGAALGVTMTNKKMESVKKLSTVLKYATIPEGVSESVDDDDEEEV